MGLAGETLTGTAGLGFWKLLGSGRGGFSLRPDLSRYALLAVWESTAHAQQFFEESALSLAYQHQSVEQWTVWLAPFRSHGQWSGINPFAGPTPIETASGPVAVLTRAAIRWSKLPHFWLSVPAVSRALECASGLRASIGVGELPFVRQATFSLWQSEDEMLAYAYQQKHRDVIRRTRRERWYREELFARFTPLAAEGRWNGENPLAELSRCVDLTCT